MIEDIKGMEIFDSRGVPTLEVLCLLDDGRTTRASVPSGAFVSGNEAVPAKDIKTAVRNIEQVIAPTLKGRDPSEQRRLDSDLIGLDGSLNKENLGGNTLLGVSMALARAGALAKGVPLYRHLAEVLGGELPTGSGAKISPMLNIINGGAHADNNLTFQEFMVVPIGEGDFYSRFIQGKRIFSNLKKRLGQLNKSTNFGEEGGFAPELNSNEEAIEMLVESIQETGLTPGKDVGIALDIAAGNIPDLSVATYPKQPLDYFSFITKEYPIISLEDPFGENDWENWQKLTGLIGKDVSIVGDDLFTTNLKRLKQGIELKAANAISIKPNQIGTVSETLDTIKEAKENKIDFQISHRAGETEDTFISDLAVATDTKYLKAGAPNRGERIAKYNQVIRIQNELKSGGV